MPIIKLDTSTFSQHCTHCNEERILDFGVLRATDADATRDTPLLVPPCQNCDTIELLVPSRAGAPAHPDAGSYGHLHQLLVDELAVRWCTTTGGTTARSTSSGLAKWFPEGLTLAAPSEFERAERTPNHG